MIGSVLFAVRPKISLSKKSRKSTRLLLYTDLLNMFIQDLIKLEMLGYANHKNKKKRW